jgi:hypothetical protein
MYSAVEYVTHGMSENRTTPMCKEAHPRRSLLCTLTITAIVVLIGVTSDRAISKALGYRLDYGSRVLFPAGQESFSSVSQLGRNWVLPSLISIGQNSRRVKLITAFSVEMKNAWSIFSPPNRFSCRNTKAQR